MHPIVHCTPIQNWIFKLLRIFHMYIQYTEYSTYSTVIYLAERLWFAWSLFIYCSCNPFLWSYIYVYPFKYNLLHISDAFLAMQLIKTLFFSFSVLVLAFLCLAFLCSRLFKILTNCTKKLECTFLIFLQVGI